MKSSIDKTIKGNVSRFDEDVRRTGTYSYTAEKLSAKYANSRISRCIDESYDFSGKHVLDLGCGDGTYTLEFAQRGVASILGIDPAEAAINSAIEKSISQGVAEKVGFKVGNIYALKDVLDGRRFDCVVLRGVLHHLPDPAGAIASIADLSDTIIILEPNGYNPVLKVLEKISRYHIEHEEQSFLTGTIKKWVCSIDFMPTVVGHVNLVPMFCPDWLARLCKICEPVVEKTPLLRLIMCGQLIMVARKNK